MAKWDGKDKKSRNYDNKHKNVKVLPKAIEIIERKTGITPKTTDALVSEPEIMPQKVSTEIVEAKSNNLMTVPKREYNLHDNLSNSLAIVEDEVMKGYIVNLTQCDIVPFTEKYNENQSEIQFFKISELVYQKDEFTVDKLSMVFQALANKPCNLILMLRSNSRKTDFYLGCRPKDGQSSATMLKMLQQNLEGFFQGSITKPFYNENLQVCLNDIKSSSRSVSCASCVADYNQNQDYIDNSNFMQGLEKFVNAMQNRSYTAVFIAESISNKELQDQKHKYEKIYSELSPFADFQINFSNSDGKSNSISETEGKNYSVTNTVNEGISEGIANGTIHTEGTSETHGKTVTKSDTHSVTDSKAEGKSKAKGIADGKNESTTNTFNVGINVGANVGNSIGTSITSTIGSAVTNSVSGSASFMGIGGSIGSAVSNFSSMAVGLMNTVSYGINGGLSGGYSRGKTHGTSHTESVTDTISNTLTHGITESHGKSIGRSITEGKSTSDAESETKSVTKNIGQSSAYGEGVSVSSGNTISDSFSTTKGITLNAKDMAVTSILNKLQKHLDRLEECESFGMWNFAAYFLGNSLSESETAASTYKAIISGSNTSLERTAINTWNEPKAVKELLPYLENFEHPNFVYNGFSYEGPRRIDVNPALWVSTKELAIHMGLPRHSVSGLPVFEHTQFGQEVVSKNANSSNNIQLGNIYNLGKKLANDVFLDLNSLTKHTFVTGSTGSGKSNCVYTLLSAIKNKIPFLVIEPAKGEYGKIFPNACHYGTNSKLGKILKINPFSFPKEIHVLEHIDRIVEIFNVCWPMYAAMPAVLKDSIISAYESAGWDLENSENVKVPGLFPTFEDVLRELSSIIGKSEYSSDTKGDYIGSLSTRLKSLTNGINGNIFVKDELDFEEILNNNSIIDISRIGATETKSLIMGLLVLKLQEYNMASSNGTNQDLKHITVIEEAHNLLKKTSTEQHSETSNLVGKSVEMLTNAIAEMRTYGEGFVIVDQAPDLLDTAVIRNTNTKIVFRLPENMDREITGGAMAFKEEQISELSKIPTGVAAVFQNDWQEPVLCQLKLFEYKELLVTRQNSKDISEVFDKNNVLHLLLKKELNKSELDAFTKQIVKANVSSKVCKDLILNINSKNRLFEWALSDYIHKFYNLSDIFVGTSSCNRLEELAEIMLQNISSEFSGFNDNEMISILYHICRGEHEKYPENEAIEVLRTEYLKERMM